MSYVSFIPCRCFSFYNYLQQPLPTITDDILAELYSREIYDVIPIITPSGPMNGFVINQLPEDPLTEYAVNIVNGWIHCINGIPVGTILHSPPMPEVFDTVDNFSEYESGTEFSYDSSASTSASGQEEYIELEGI